MDFESGRILDTTLRDGSYVINFAFTAAQTADLCRELDRLGFPLIEIGHGVGLGASEAGHGVAAETDEAYLKAAAESGVSADWGMFCIPGIATLDHVDMAADYGMKFIRIGTNVTEAPASRPFIERARKKNMRVMGNFMKSYTLPHGEFAHFAKMSADFGAEVVYIVDSAGGMTVAELERYIAAIRERTDVPIGFHGHNNLGLAVALSMRAVELGVAIVDTSLQGMGRSAGNTPTEQFLSVLSRSGYAHAFDVVDVADVGEQYIRPLLSQVGIDSLDMISGLAQFHSSYMGVIRRYAHQYRVDPRRLIIEVCQEDKVNAPAALVESKAKMLHEKMSELPSLRFPMNRYFGAEQT